MDWNDIDRLRDPGFAVVRRGYDRREVDRLLASLVDWLETDAAKDLGDLAVKRKLEFVGKSTARILVTTEDEAVQLRRLTEEECAELRSEAEAAAAEIRRAADEYAKTVRGDADDDTREARDAARAEATRLVDEGERRRAEIEAVVSELEARRDRTLQQLERLRAELASAIGTHETEEGGASESPEQAPTAKVAATGRTAPSDRKQAASRPAA
jgi:cell division septum initiation protein DivIVA